MLLSSELNFIALYPCDASRMLLLLYSQFNIIICQTHKRTHVLTHIFGSPSWIIHKIV